MKFPKEILIKLKNNRTLIIKLQDVKFLAMYEKFEAKIEISREFLEVNKYKDNIEILTEERELPEPIFK